MTKVTYMGDGTGEPTGEVGYQGHTFIAGEPVDVTDKAKLEAFKAHDHFAVAGEKGNPDEDEVDEDKEVLALRRMLDERGVTYRANANLKSLRKLAYDTPDTSKAGTEVDAPHPDLAGHGPAAAPYEPPTNAYTGKTDPEVDAAKG